MSRGKVDDRKRDWQFIMYPESMPENAFQILRKNYVRMVISPLHDSDLADEDSDSWVMKDGKKYKKPHYHVIFQFDGPVSYEQVKEISDSVNAAPPVRVKSIRGSSRYLIHLDDPDKYQYHKEECKVYNGFDLEQYLLWSTTDMQIARNDIVRYILVFEITEFADIFEYAFEHEPLWSYILQNTNTNFFKVYLTSRRHRAELRRQEANDQIDEVT